MKLQKVACNTDYTVYLDIYFMIDTAKVASSSRHFTELAQISVMYAPVNHTGSYFIQMPNKPNQQ